MRKTTATMKLEEQLKPRPADPVTRYPYRLPNVWEHPIPPQPPVELAGKR